MIGETKTEPAQLINLRYYPILETLKIEHISCNKVTKEVFKNTFTCNFEAPNFRGVSERDLGELSYYQCSDGANYWDILVLLDDQQTGYRKMQAFLSERYGQLGKQIVKVHELINKLAIIESL